jgi:hypothetical protein
MRQLWEVTDFVRSIQRRLRFGEFSRAPLRLLRFELRNDVAQTVECDWMARPADAWDSSLQRQVQAERESLQVLADAIAVRNLVFDAFPKIESAVLRGFHQPAREPPKMIVLGMLSREIPAMHRISSLVMRAKLYGFCFCFEDGMLRPLQQVANRTEQYIA